MTNERNDRSQYRRQSGQDQCENISVVSEDWTIGDRINAAFPFDVEPRPLLTRNPSLAPVVVDGVLRSGIMSKTGLYGLFRTDNHEMVSRSSVTAAYHVHTKDDVIALVEAAGSTFNKDQFDILCDFHNGHRVVIQPGIEYRKSIFGTEDNVFPRIVIDAGYDGRSFKALMGYWRDLCRNMAMIGSVDSCCVKIRHLKSLQPRMDELIGSMQNLWQGWGNLTASLQQMERNTVQLADFLRKVYGWQPGEEGPSRTSYNNRHDLVVKTIRQEARLAGRPEVPVVPVVACNQERWHSAGSGGSVEVTGYQAFQGVQGYAQHHSHRQGMSGVEGTALDIRRAVLAFGSKHVAKAERLALGMPVNIFNN